MLDVFKVVQPVVSKEVAKKEVIEEDRLNISLFVTCILSRCQSADNVVRIKFVESDCSCKDE